MRSVLQTEQMKRPQPLLTGPHHFKAIHHLDALWMLSNSAISLEVLWCPKLHTGFEVRPHQHRTEQDNQ